MTKIQPEQVWETRPNLNAPWCRVKVVNVTLDAVSRVRFKVMRRFANRQRVGKWQRRHSASGCYWQFLRRPLKFACRFASTVITVASSEGNLKEAAVIETSRIAKVRSVSASLWIAPDLIGHICPK